eukprot:g71486.t1
MQGYLLKTKIQRPEPTGTDMLQDVNHCKVCIASGVQVCSEWHFNEEEIPEEKEEAKEEDSEDTDNGKDGLFTEGLSAPKNTTKVSNSVHVT